MRGRVGASAVGIAVVAMILGRSGGRRDLRTGRPVAGATAFAAHFAEAFSIEVSAAASPERWARVVFEDAPAPVRSALLLGWRFGLGLRLEPLGTADQVLGWRIIGSTADEVVLEAESAVLHARKTLHLDGPQLTVATLVRFRGRWGRWLWRAALPVHRRLEPYLLARAAHRSDGRARER